MAEGNGRRERTKRWDRGQQRERKVQFMVEEVREPDGQGGLELVDLIVHEDREEVRMALSDIEAVGQFVGGAFQLVPIREQHPRGGYVVTGWLFKWTSSMPPAQRPKVIPDPAYQGQPEPESEPEPEFEPLPAHVEEALAE